MALNNPYAQYQENSIYTSTPEELTLMLYNGLVKFIMQAQQGINEKSIEKTNNSIIKAQNIITELRSTLDFKYEIAKQLDSIYDYLYNRLLSANIKKSNEELEEALGFAKELRDTWTQAMKLSKKK